MKNLTPNLSEFIGPALLDAFRDDQRKWAMDWLAKFDGCFLSSEKHSPEDFQMISDITDYAHLRPVATPVRLGIGPRGLAS